MLFLNFGAYEGFEMHWPSEKEKSLKRIRRIKREEEKEEKGKRKWWNYRSK